MVAIGCVVIPEAKQSFSPYITRIKAFMLQWIL